VARGGSGTPSRIISVWLTGPIKRRSGRKDDQRPHCNVLLLTLTLIGREASGKCRAGLWEGFRCHMVAGGCSALLPLVGTGEKRVVSEWSFFSSWGTPQRAMGGLERQ
jgi:hypothetical protein